MPDEKHSESVKEQPEKQRPNAQLIGAPPSPDNKPSTAAKPVSESHEKTEIQRLEERLSRAEKWMIWLTGAIAFWGLCGVVVGVLQWSAMKGQLAEMKSGAADTHILAQAAKKQAEKAETISSSIQQAVGEMDTTNLRSKQVLDATIAASQLDQRAWVGVVDVATDGGKVDGDAFSFRSIGIAIRNTGKTPALKMTAYCCTYLSRLWSDKEIPDYDTEMIRNQEGERADFEKTIKQHPEMAERMTRWQKRWEKQMEAAKTEGRHEGALAPQAVIVINTGVSMSMSGLELLPPPKVIKPEEMRPYFERASQRPKLFYAVGKIVYSDIFPNTKQHTTTICVVRNPGPSSLTFGICSQGRMD
jgi:hypothetical protein